MSRVVVDSVSRCPLPAGSHPSPLMTGSAGYPADMGGLRAFSSHEKACAGSVPCPQKRFFRKCWLWALPARSPRFTASCAGKSCLVIAPDLLGSRSSYPAWGPGRCAKMTKVLLLLFLFTAPAWAQSRLVFAWQSNPENTASWPPCSQMVAKRCRTGYALTDVTKPSAPVIVNSSIAQDASTYTLTPLPKPGLHVYNLTINARGSAGAAIQSAPATVRLALPRDLHTATGLNEGARMKPLPDRLLCNLLSWLK